MIRDCTLIDASAEQIGLVLILLLSKDTIFCTDGTRLQTDHQECKIVHCPINIAAGQRVINDVYHIPSAKESL